MEGEKKAAEIFKIPKKRLRRARVHPSIRIQGTSLTGDDKGEILHML